MFKPNYSSASSLALTRLRQQVFWEPKSSADVDAVLRAYAAENVGDKSVGARIISEAVPTAPTC